MLVTWPNAGNPQVTPITPNPTMGGNIKNTSMALKGSGKRRPSATVAKDVMDPNVMDVLMKTIHPVLNGFMPQFPVMNQVNPAGNIKNAAMPISNKQVAVDPSFNATMPPGLMNLISQYKPAPVNPYFDGGNQGMTVANPDANVNQAPQFNPMMLQRLMMLRSLFGGAGPMMRPSF